MYKPTGDITSAKYVIVGEAPASEELRQGRPFVGASGEIFNDALYNAGINRFDCYITNVFSGILRKNPKKKHLPWLCSDEPVWLPSSGSRKADFSEQGRLHRDRLLRELQQTNATILCLGEVALKALTGKGPISSWRGSFLTADLLPNRPNCIATFHPATVLYGEDVNRWYIVSDFRRAVRQQEAKTLIRPDYEMILRPTFFDCIGILNMLLETGLPYTCDIEVKSRQTSMISLAWSAKHSISIPTQGWSEREEVELWFTISRLLTQTGQMKIFHNAAFDVQFLMQVHKIVVAPPIHDTMVLYAVLYPEFKKSLGTLASLYTDQPYWKNMVSHRGEIEKEEG